MPCRSQVPHSPGTIVHHLWAAIVSLSLSLGGPANSLGHVDIIIQALCGYGLTWHLQSVS